MVILMKFNINEKDLILSDSFKKKEKEFNKTLDTITNIEKDKISQTIGAKLFFSHFKSTYIHKTNKHPPYKRFKFIFDDLIGSFPKANEKQIKKHLYLNGIFKYNIYLFIILIILIIFNTFITYYYSSDWFLLATSNLSIILLWSSYENN